MALGNQPGSSLSKKISALESSGFSPNEINEVLKRFGSLAPGDFDVKMNMVSVTVITSVIASVSAGS